MQIKLNKMEYTINGKKDQIDFSSKNVITGENDYGKSLLISLLLSSLGSLSEKNRMIDLVQEKQTFSCKSTLSYDVIGNGYKSDGQLKKVVATFSYKKGDSNPSYSMTINGIDASVTGTTAYAREIFRIIGMPRRIVWEKSLTTLFMDDILRFTTLMQDNINNVNEYAKVLPIYKAQRVRTGIVMQFFLNPNADLIKSLIDNEDLFREVQLSTVVGDLQKTVVHRSMNFNLEDRRRLKDISKQIKNWREENTIERRAVTVIDKELLFIELSRKSEHSTEKTGVLRYLEELRKNDLVPKEVDLWINENINALKVDYFSGLDANEEGLRKARKEHIAKSKVLTKSINKYTNDLETDEIAYVLNEVVSGISPEKVKVSPVIEQMKKHFRDQYSTILRNFSKEFLDGNKTIKWDRFGGATQLINNVERVVALNKNLSNKNIILPTIIDGILAEDFGNSNIDAHWVRSAAEANNQLVTAYSNGDSSNEGVHENTNKIINEHKEVFVIHNLKESLV